MADPGTEFCYQSLRSLLYSCLLLLKTRTDKMKHRKERESRESEGVH